VKANPQKAAELFEKGAKGGSSFCMLLFAQCLEAARASTKTSSKPRPGIARRPGAATSAPAIGARKTTFSLSPASNASLHGPPKISLPAGEPLSNTASRFAMKPGTLKTVALTASISLLVSACENMTPGENAAVFGTSAGILGAGIARAAGASTGESLAIGAAAGVVVGMTAYIIAKHKATERQRRIAEERARIYYAHLAAEKKATLKQKKSALYRRGYREK